MRCNESSGDLFLGRDERLEKWMIDQKKDRQLCVVETGGVVGVVKVAERKPFSVGKKEEGSDYLSRDENINASVPVSHMIIIAQFDWLADRKVW